MHRRRFHQWLGLAGAAGLLTGPALPVRAQSRPLLKAGDQKGGLHALLEAAGELKGLSYDIQWTEFPAAAPLAEALNAQAVDLGPIGDAPLIFSLAAGSRVKAFAVNRSDAYGTAVLVAPNSTLKDARDLRACSASPTGRAAVFSGWDARRGAPSIARLSTSAATPQTARKGHCPKGWSEIGRLGAPAACMGTSPCGASGPPTHPDCAPTRPVRDTEHALEAAAWPPTVARSGTLSP